MRAQIWGTRGSIPCPGQRWSRYGGNTSCVAVSGDDPASIVILDAGTGIIGLGGEFPDQVRRVDILLSHLHMDHIIGLGFFAPLFDLDMEVHIWGPVSTALDLRARLTRYLSPPLFPVRLRELPCRLEIHDVPLERFDVPGIACTANLVCHPGSSVGYRLEAGGVLAYLPDHEPALGASPFPGDPTWTSGYALAAGADLLIHDAQFADSEYEAKRGWGHSTIGHAVTFAELAGASRLVAFHHDPAHDDDWLDNAYATLPAARVPVTPAREGDVFTV